MSNVPLEQGLVEVTAQEMSNVPLEQSLIEVTDEEWHDFDEMMLEVEMDIFLQFIDENVVIQQFLEYDDYLLLADSYILAMVFTYFRRAKYTPDHYTTYNFFVALLLAHDMEEEGDMKLNIYYWALGSEWLQHYKELDNSRNDLWKAMEFSALVTRECCKEVMLMRPGHYIWQRNRQEIHDDDDSSTTIRGTYHLSARTCEHFIAVRYPLSSLRS